MSTVKTQHIIKGKIGPLIYYEMNGKQYVRTAPVKVRYPNTKGQQHYKERFAMSSTLASVLYKLFKSWFLETTNEGKRAYPQLKALIQRTGIKITQTDEQELGTQEYNWETLELTEGSLSPLQLSKTLEDTSITINWKEQTTAVSSTVVYLIEIDPIELKARKVSAALQYGSLKMDAYNAENHYYTFWIQSHEKKMKVSPSVKV